MMKKIISLSIIISFAINFAWAQQNKLPANFDKTVQAEYAKVQKKWEGTYDDYKKIYTEWYLQQQINNAKSESTNPDNPACDDPGFESGTLNTADWYGYYEKFTGSSFDCSDASSNNINNSGWVQGLVDVLPGTCEYPNWTVSSTQTINHCTVTAGCVAQPESGQSHFHIVSIGSDPIISSVPMVRPSGGLHALRLGNAYPYNGTEKLVKQFIVTNSNQVFSFWYALVMGLPDDGSHTLPGQAPTFIVQVIDNTTGLTHNALVNLSGGNNYIAGGDPLLNSTLAYLNPCNINPPPGQSMDYKPWTFCSFSLASLIGDDISVEIITRDCALGGHFCYAYLDDFCSKSDPSNPTGYIGLGDVSKCGLPGNICVNYTLPTDGTNIGAVQLTLTFLQNGVTIGTTLTSPVLSSGGNYCFNLTSANSPASDFDFKITGNFTLSGSSLPSQYIGSSPDGVQPGQNNDYKVSCGPPPPICSTCKTVIKSESLTQGSLTTGTVYNLQALTLNFTSLTALQEVNISIANLSYTWDKDGCKNCKTDAIGRGCLYPQSAAQTIGTLVWDNVHASGIPPAANPTECPGELIWDLGSPLPPNSYSVPINITLPVPTVPGCCNLHLNSFCLKVSYKDINCNTCDTIICMDTVNCCKGGYWKSEEYSWPPNPNKTAKQAGGGIGTPIGNVVNIKCNNQQTPYVFTCNALYNLQATYSCADKSCPAKTTYHVFGPSGISGTLPAAYTPTASGTYPITYYAWCGNKICDSCRFWITVSCGSNGACTCSFNPVLSGEGHPNSPVACGGSVTLFASNIPVSLNPGFACVNTDGTSCATPGTFTATLTNVATAAVTTLTGPNYSYTFTTSGVYTYTLTGNCGGNTCSCSFNLVIP